MARCSHACRFYKGKVGKVGRRLLGAPCAEDADCLQTKIVKEMPLEGVRYPHLQGPNNMKKK